MKKTELFKNLAYFSGDDFHQFHLFLKSPVFKNPGGLVKLFGIISKERNLILNGELESLKNKILSRVKVSEGTLRKSLSYLNKSLIEYLRYKALYKDELHTEILLNDFLVKNNNTSAFKNLTARTENILKKNFGETEQYFIDAASHCLNKLNLLVIENKFTENRVREEQKTLAKEMAVNLYMFNLQKLVFTFVNLVTADIDTGNSGIREQPLSFEIFFDENDITAEIQANDNIHILFILLQRVYELYGDIINDYKFTLFNDCYFENHGRVPVYARKKYLNLLINYCVLRQRLHDPDRVYAEKELRLLYQFIDNEYYADSSTRYLNSMTYHNFITGCLRVNNYKIMKKFIDNHSDKLMPEERDKLKYFGLAHYYFCIKNYAKSLKNINSINNPGRFYKYDLRNLELKIYYEKNNLLNIESVIHNYRSCVLKDGILTTYDRNWLLFFLKYFRKFVSFVSKPKSAGTYIEFSMLLDKIEKEKNFAMQKWMISEIKQILSKQTIPARIYGNR